jgi:hypothetical protein
MEPGCQWQIVPEMTKVIIRDSGRFTAAPATEIASALGLMGDVVGLSHECDFPNEANTRPRVTHCPVHDAGLASKEVDEWVRGAPQERHDLHDR